MSQASGWLPGTRGKYIVIGAFNEWDGFKLAISVPDLKVAGFDASGDKCISLYFIPLLDASKTSFSMDEGKFFAAKYESIRPEDPSSHYSFSSMNDELSKKITELYGVEPKEVQKAPSEEYDKECSIKSWPKGNESIRLYVDYKKIVFDQSNGFAKANSILLGRDYDFAISNTSLIYSSNELFKEYSIIAKIMKAEREKDTQAEEQKKREEVESRGTDGL